jgi:hypothetical protein
MEQESDGTGKRWISKERRLNAPGMCKAETGQKKG